MEPTEQRCQQATDSGNVTTLHMYLRETTAIDDWLDRMGALSMAAASWQVYTTPGGSALLHRLQTSVGCHSKYARFFTGTLGWFGNG